MSRKSPKHWTQCECDACWRQRVFERLGSDPANRPWVDAGDASECLHRRRLENAK
jgi:hypothetical protein